MTLPKGKYILRITPESAFLAGGSESGFSSTKQTSRDSFGYPCIRASAVKGALRIQAERIAPAVVSSVDCSASHPGSLCEASGATACIVCRLFGGLSSQAALEFSDGVLSPETISMVGAAATLFVKRTGVRISRALKTAAEQALYEEEVVQPAAGLSFESTLVVRQDLDDDEKWLLEASLATTKFLGAGATRGMGMVSMQLEAATPERPATEVKEQFVPGSLLSLDVSLNLGKAGQFRVNGSHQPSSFYESMDQIPGSVIRGALAKAWLDEGGSTTEEDFLNLFTKGDLASTFFRPFSGTVGVQGDFRPIRPIPITTRICKQHPGWQRGAVMEGGPASHGHFDLLLPLLANRIIEAATGKTLPFTEECPVAGCGSKLIREYGYYSGNLKTSTGRKVITRVALGRSLGTAREGALFSYETITPASRDEELILYGKLRVRDANEKAVEFLNTLRTLTIGAKPSIGFGWARVRFTKAHVADAKAWDRVQRFNNLLKAYTGILENGLGGHSKNKEEFYVPLTLTSPLLLTAQTLEQTLHSSLNLQDAESKPFAVEHAIWESSTVGSFNAALKLPGPGYSAIEQGSVVILRVSYEDRQNVVSALLQLGQNGLGERTFEGYGQFEVCSEIHLEIEDFLGLEEGKHEHSR